MEFLPKAWEGLEHWLPHREFWACSPGKSWMFVVSSELSADKIHKWFNFAMCFVDPKKLSSKTAETGKNTLSATPLICSSCTQSSGPMDRIIITSSLLGRWVQKNRFFKTSTSSIWNVWPCFLPVQKRPNF